MSIYTNMGGRVSKQLPSLYVNYDGSNKTLANAYTNIDGASKLIYEKLYTWGKYTWYNSGTKSYSLIDSGGGSPISSDVSSITTFYLYKTIRFIEQDETVNYELSNRICIAITYSNSYISYIDINTQRYTISSYDAETTYTLTNGINFKKIGHSIYLYFTGNFYDADFLYNFNRGDPYIYKAINDTTHTPIYMPKTLHFDFAGTHEYTYQQYSVSTQYLWKPNAVEYVTSTNQNEYSINNTSVNVNSNYYYDSSQYFPYNPTYRFIG